MESAGVELAYSRVPQGPDQDQPGPRVSQKSLLVLVVLVPCSIALDAYFFSRLYCQLPAVSSLTSDITSGHPIHVLPSKPLAHLEDGPDVVHENQMLHWSINDETLLRNMDHEQGRLRVQGGGLYHVYSKVSFMNSRRFHHWVVLSVPGHAADVTLMRSSESSRRGQCNSFLVGMFHLCRGCVIFVKVSDTSELLRGSTHNFFGAFMI